MSIGIIGSGALGSNIARMLARQGIAAMISNNRGPESLNALVRELGSYITAVTLEQAASADIVFAAVRWKAAEGLFRELPRWEGRIVVDATNPVEFLDPSSPKADDPTNPLAAYGIKAIDLDGRHSSEVFREFVPGARVVKAFNHLEAELLSDPMTVGGQRILFYSGDDEDAKRDIADIMEAAGFCAINLGTLSAGAALTSLPFGPLGLHKLVKV